jgi:hypothetical protein
VYVVCAAVIKQFEVYNTMAIEGKYCCAVWLEKKGAKEVEEVIPSNWINVEKKIVRFPKDPAKKLAELIISRCKPNSTWCTVVCAWEGGVVNCVEVQCCVCMGRRRSELCGGAVGLLFVCMGRRRSKLCCVEVQLFVTLWLYLKHTLNNICFISVVQI